MAAVTISPVTSSASNSASRRKLVGLTELAPPAERYDLGENVKPLSGEAEAPRIRRSPISPVRVNFQPEDWAQPSNANIETSHHAHQRPSPHLPLYEQSNQQGLSRDDTTRRSNDVLEKGLRISTVPTGRKPEDGREPTACLVGPETEEFGANGDSSKDLHRSSRESDATASTSQQQTSTKSSATTSASSVSCLNEASDGQDASGELSPESSVIEDSVTRNEAVPPLQYHHSAFLPRVSTVQAGQDPKAQSNSNLLEPGVVINRHLTPNSNYHRQSSLQRPPSSYSVYSDAASRGRSPGQGSDSIDRSRSAQSRKSPENRQSYAELLNVPYPQPGPAPITFDNSQLRNVVGTNASLLSTEKTLEMYRQNVTKTNDFSIQYSFAVFLIATAQERGLSLDESRRKKSAKSGKDAGSPSVEETTSSPHDLVREARAILQKLASNGYPFAQYYLADGYASGLFSKGKEDYNAAFPLFVLAAKHGHAESAYRTGLCYEFGWGCRKDPAKAVQFLRTAATKRHPGAMTRIGRACLSGDLGEKRYREGIKWLKLATESADATYNAAPYHLGCLYETGYGDDIFQDEDYAAELFTQAADLGHPEANYRMGDAYEHGKLNCPRDPALSVHFYTGAAERGHAAAMMGLCAWYMVGAEPILEKDEEEAYEWARRSAELGYVKAQYALGFFTETGIGCRRDILEANVWYVKAADAGDERAKQRLAAIRAAVSGGAPIEAVLSRNSKGKKHHREAKDDKECIVM